MPKKTGLTAAKKRDPREASEVNEEEARNLAWTVIRIVEEYSRKRDISPRQSFSALVRAML